jgi:hypothetical protein
MYPLWIRDLLLWFAHHDLFTPKWSRHIFDEWLSVMKRTGVPEPEAQRRIDLVNDAFPDAIVKNYEPLIPTLKLQDEGVDFLGPFKGYPGYNLLCCLSQGIHRYQNLPALPGT